MRIAIGFMKLADRQQTGVLTLRARVGLHADSIKPGDAAQHGFQLVNHLLVALGLRQRNKGMQLTEFWPGDGNHLSRCVQLHGAGAERDHRMVKRQVLVLQRLDVTQHLGFRVVAVEHWMGQKIGSTAQPGGDARLSADNLCIQRGQILPMRLTDNYGQQRFNRSTGSGFIQADTHRITVDHTQVYTRGACASDNLASLTRHIQGQGVEEALITQSDTRRLQACSQNGSQAMYPVGNDLEALRTMIDRVKAGYVGQ